jgi:NAD(P)-dependent dehydrogenase (short-subunit alcohol dehydrogenase family)
MRIWRRIAQRLALGYVRRCRRTRRRKPIYSEVDRRGTLIVLVHNNGTTGPHSPLVEAATETLDRVLDVNLRGTLLSAREAVGRMSTRLGGSGGSTITNGLAREVANEGIRVNAVSPGPVVTEMHRPGKLEVGAKRAPMQRAGTPEEVASGVLFLASEEAPDVTGANLAGGKSTRANTCLGREFGNS